MRMLVVTALLFSAACSAQPEVSQPGAPAKRADSQHAGITTPHGDHSPHHGGMVLMNGEMHYEVVFDPAGKHRVWFSDAVREELPASMASKVIMAITRKNDTRPEMLTLEIDDSGESWVANGKPLNGEAMVKLNYVARGEPFEIEIPVR